MLPLPFWFPLSYSVVGPCISLVGPPCSCHHQVLVTAHAILANGGAMAPVGMNLVAMAAKRHSVPCVMLCGMFKLSPLFPHEPGVSFNDFKVGH